MTETERILTELAQEIIINNLRHLNQGIEDFNNLLSRDPEAALQNLSMLSKEDQQTPAAIIEAMIDATGWRCLDGSLSKEDIYLDPCCGRGGILAYLHKHYGIPKENLYGIDIKQENVTLCTKLGFNVIKGDALTTQAYTDIIEVVKKIKGDSMVKITKGIMNPPYDGSLHLQILNVALTQMTKANPDCKVVSIQPARWIEDPLAEYKQGTDYKKYKTSIVNKLNKIVLASGSDMSDKFKILTNSDLGIFVFNNTDEKYSLDNKIDLVKKIISKITVSIGDKAEHNVKDGVRCEIKEIQPTNSASKTLCVEVVKGEGEVVFTDGFNENGTYWTETRKKTGCAIHTIGDPFLYSIKFDTIEQANNFAESCRTKFYKNLVALLKYDMHTPLDFLPYMEDYSHVWTDDDYCKFFALTEAEAAFMKRDVEDYRIKDFINYVKFED